MKKSYIMRIIASCLSIMIIFILLPVPAQAKVYTNRTDLDGSMFTERPALITKLNSIFDGKASIYYDSKCTSLVNTKIGTKSVPDDKNRKYVGKEGKTNKGTSCWIYANGVYYTLFGELTASGENSAIEKNSQKLSISGNKKMTYKNFQSWGVRAEPGALVRVSGHSLIILKYDSSKIYYLDGNGDGKGLVAVREHSWSDNPWRNGTVSYIIQPKESHFKKLYPTYLEQCTEYQCSGTITVTAATTVKTLPCSRSTNKESSDVRSAKKNERYKVQGLYKNTAGNYWYKVVGVVDSQNMLTPVNGYIYAGDSAPVLSGWSGYLSRDGKSLTQSFNDDASVNNISGLYELSPQCAPNSRLDAENGSKKSGTNVQIYAKNGTEAQLFRFTPLNNGYYKITCVVSGMALDVSGGIALSGNNVHLYTPNGSDAQQWKLVSAGDGYYYIVSKLNTNMCLDVWNKGSANGTNVHIWEKNNSSAQKWKLIR